MKNFILSLILMIACISIHAQEYGAAAFLNATFVTINDDFADSVNDNIDAIDDVEINDRTTGFGLEAYGFRDKIAGGFNVSYYKIKSDRSDKAEFTSINVLFKGGYNFSNNPITQLIPAVRFGLATNIMDIPYVATDVITFGDAVVSDDTKFTNLTPFYGVELAVHRAIGQGKTALLVGVAAYIDFALGDTDWKDGSTTVNNLILDTYGNYGLTVKIGGGWLGQWGSRGYYD